MSYPYHDNYPPIRSYSLDAYRKEKEERKNNFVPVELKSLTSAETTFEDLKKVNEPPPLFHIVRDGYRYDYFFVKKKRSDKLFLIFSGARKKDDYIPLFKRNLWNHLFGGDVLYISDPIFFKNPEIGIGWYAGDNFCEPFVAISEIVKLIRDKGGYEKLVSYGSSGGGFAALKISDYVSCDCAALNPQIFPRRYPHYANYAKLAAIEETEEFAGRLTINIHRSSRYLIVQNDDDDHHMRKHLLPLLASLNLPVKYGLSGAENFYAWIFHSEGGHNLSENGALMQVIFFLLEKIAANPDEKELAALDNLALAVSEFWAMLGGIKKE